MLAALDSLHQQPTLLCGLLQRARPYSPEPATALSRNYRFGTYHLVCWPDTGTNIYAGAMSQESPPEGSKEHEKFRPSRFMRERRPYLYSDSVVTTERTVSRDVLSYHLETLTNQKDESRFEEFARRLAEKFISPNLRPQTGPVGGGDGKTDSETYPVASAIANRWFVPNLAGAQERWAFAFSAKKDWRGKVRSDVSDIVGTKRGYPRIYFITNQFVPAKDSAKAQDTLLKKHGVPVTILDRTWLLDRVFEHNSLDIAVEVLGVGAGTEHQAQKLGPNDFERTTELDALEKAIGDGTNYNGTLHALAGDCLRAAKLARGLERPRHEVEGRFQRAIRIARENDLQTQELAALYDLAWTSYFWFDDFATLNSLYDEVERLALPSDTADEIERLSNLLPLLRTSVKFGMLTTESAKLSTRGADLLKALDRVREDTSRPNNSLHAHALSLLVRLAQAAHTDDEDLDDLWTEFRGVIEQADGLGTFPFQSIADALTEVGAFVAESAAFDLLYEVITDALAARRSEGEAAKKNSQRGFQKLEKGLPYDAIRWLGRAVGLLVKEEYEAELISALIGSSIAYEEAGLLWASRNYALAAASHGFSAFKRTGSIDEVSPAVLSRQFWTELRLGRVPNVLSAFELGMLARNARAKTKEQREASDKKRIDQGNMLGALLLRTAFADLPRVAKLADGLERLGLEQGRMALLFLMGREDILRQDGSVPPEETPEGYQEFFDHWSSYGDRTDLPEEPSYLLDDEVALRSRVLGCEVSVTCANNLTSIGIGEAILGTLEALLATSLSHRILPHLDTLNLEITPSESAPLTPSLQFEDKNGVTVGVVTHAPRLNYTSLEEAIAFPRWLQYAVVEVFVRFAVPADVDKWGASVLGEENGFSRALTFSNVPNMLGTIFGDKNRLSIDEWIEEGDVVHDVKRPTPWRPKLQNRKAEKQIEGPKFGKGDPPEEMRNTERMKHTDVRVVTPIDVHKWDAAAWNAVYFQTAPGLPDWPPVLALAFEHREPAEGIFQGLRSRFGFDDRDHSLRIAVIKGIIISNPHAYAVIVGPNTDRLPITRGGAIGFVSRVNIMRPKSTQNLDAFLSEFRRHGRYLLAPAHLPNRDGTPEPLIDLSLGKYDLVVREAWQIAENDPDGSALVLDDPPVIPIDQANAPVLKALKWMEKMRKKAD